LKAYKKAKGTPQDRYSFPQTESQEIGWDPKPLVSEANSSNKSLLIHEPVNNY